LKLISAILIVLALVPAAVEGLRADGGRDAEPVRRRAESSALQKED
jgi:hypothetical protein